MVLSTSTYLNGFSAIVCMSIGIIYGIYFIYLYMHMKKSSMSWIIITSFAAGFLYFGNVVSFFSLILTGNNLTATLYGLFSYTSVAILAFTGIYTCISIPNAERKTLVLLLYGIIGVVYLISLYVFPNRMISGNNPAAGELLVISLNSLASDILKIYTGTFFLLSFNFIWFSRKEESEKKKHMLMLGFGWFLLMIAYLLEIFFAESNYDLIVIDRIVMAISFVLMFTGFSPPKVERKNKI